MRDELYAVIAGGGTGGHLSPALAVAEALVARGHARGEIEFVGSARGMDSKVVPSAGFRLHELPGRGIQRRLCKDSALALVALAEATVRATGLAIKRRPRVVVSVGGYAAFPSAFAALLLRIPLLVVVLDAVPTGANRFLSHFASRNAIAFSGARVPRATLTGAPLRKEVLAVATSPEAEARTRERIGVERRRRLLVVFGGSLGAGSVNAAALELARSWVDRKDVAIYHLAGDRNFDEVRRRAGHLGLLDRSRMDLEYVLAGYDPRLEEVLAACDLAICRAGASSVAELAALGVPSLLVPLPGAPRDHQGRNAAALAAAGAALVIADPELSGERLAASIERCLEGDGKLEHMAAAARRLARRDAADKVAELAEELAARPGRRPL